MSKIRVIVLNFLLLSLPVLAWAAEGLEIPEAMGKKVKLEGLGAFNHFFAQWYNDNLWVYAIMVTVLMGAVGGIIALVTDVFLKSIGMQVSKIEHHE